MRTELRLPFFKQGDDLAQRLDRMDNISALKDYADALENAATTLREVAEGVRDAEEVKITADTHFISVEGPDDILEPLVERGLLMVEEDYEEEEEDEDTTL